MTIPRSPSAQKALGFTVIELVLVLMLISIMASIIPSAFSIPPSRQVENNATAIATHLEMARTESLSNRRLVQIAFDVGAGTYTGYIDHDGDDAIGAVSAETAAFPELGQRSLSDLIVFGRGSAEAVPGDGTSDAVTLPGNALTLNDQGIPDPWGTMGTIYLVHSREPTAVAAISVSSAGSFKVWRWDEEASSWR